MEKLKIFLPIIVEGKYDKARLMSVCDAHIIVTDGFGIFRENEKKALLRRLCEKSKVIVLTDADGGGLVIRSHLKKILPPDRVINLYIPPIEGKERRKEERSKEGLLGVEGMENDLLYSILEPYSGEALPERENDPVTKSEMYSDGLFGRDRSAYLRQKLLFELNLPKNLSSNALVEAINMLSLRGEYDKFIERTCKEND
jgi:ribonuclease M5